MRYSFWHDRFGGPGRWSASHNCPACTSCLIAVTAGSRPIEVVITLRVRLICGGDEAADCSGLRLEGRRSLRQVGSHYFLKPCRHGSHSLGYQSRFFPYEIVSSPGSSCG